MSDLNKLTPRMIRPCATDLRGVACSLCEKTHSSWEADVPLSEDSVFVCSLCMLYRTDWGTHSRSRIDLVVHEQGKRRPAAYSKDSNGFLSNCSDADNVLGSIVLALRYERTQGLVDKITPKEAL